MKQITVNIKPTDKSMQPELQHKIDKKTKPVGSLGILEELALKMGLIQQSLFPVAERKGVIVFAADHGITAEGISAYPADVTPQMVLNFLNGGAAINVFCRMGNIEMAVVDIGVNHDFTADKNLIDKKIRKGTRNFAVEPAMTEEEVYGALQAGMDAFSVMHKKHNLQIIGLGEMGIGNTTSASAIIAAVSGLSAEKVVGRGTGLDKKGLEHKAGVIQKALEYHKPDANNGIDILRKIGGLEIAGMAGAALAAAENGVAVVFDGLISTSAALIAARLNPAVIDFAFAGHNSVEKGHKVALEILGLRPIVDFNLRLGEGTGAALAMHVIENACAFLREMSSFEDAGVSGKL